MPNFLRGLTKDAAVDGSITDCGKLISGVRPFANSICCPRLLWRCIGS